MHYHKIYVYGRRKFKSEVSITIKSLNFTSYLLLLIKYILLNINNKLYAHFVNELTHHNMHVHISLTRWKSDKNFKCRSPARKMTNKVNFTREVKENSHNFTVT